MARKEAVTHAVHGEWTIVPGTALEVYQATGTNVPVHLISDSHPLEAAVDAEGAVRFRLRSDGITTREYGVRMHSNPANEDQSDQVVRQGIVYREAASQEQAREWARQMNAMASGPEGKRYWVLLAETVFRTRTRLPEGGEVISAWDTLPEKTGDA